VSVTERCYDAPMGKRKVAILGGGVSAMTAAFYLSSFPGWQEEYEITVYQMGWRLGGKGASGRNRKRQQRIEEHGLHIFLGFYENAFHTMQALYGELGRRPTEPLATWDQAWKKQSYVVFMEQLKQQWAPWAFDFPENSDYPGDGGEWPSAWSYLQMMIGWILRWIEGVGLSPLAAPDLAAAFHGEATAAGHFRDEVDAAAIASENRTDSEAHHDAVRSRVKEALGRVVGDVEAARHDAESVFGHLAASIARSLPADATLHRAVDHSAIRYLLDRLRGWVRAELEAKLDSDPRLRHAYIMVDLWASCAIGMIVDGLIIPPVYWFKIDDLDFRAWIGKHGATQITAYCAPINAAYALAFGEETSIGAGTGMNGILRLIGGYKGSIFWEMQAGMGDTIFGPFYQVLSRRGVQFRFFHRVDRLEVDPGAPVVRRIHIGRQVNVVPGNGSYRPLVDVKGLPCWPSEPDYDQIVEGKELEASGCDLEDWWTPWQDRGAPLVLEAGKDFDLVILGTAIASYPYVARELMDANPRFAAMVNGIQTTQTQAMQLWFGPDLAGLGWTKHKPIVGSYALWMDTWSDMSHLLVREEWPADLQPGNLAYLVSRMLDDEPLPPRSDHGYTARQLARVRTNALAWLRDSVRPLWPTACQTETPTALDWSFVIDPSGAVGEKRFEAQFIRGTVNPSERYVLSVPGSTELRLRAEETGFVNCYMTGDHTFTGINAGCVEAATMSGMNCAQAICGYPRVIVGDCLPPRLQGKAGRDG
jgi:uncharacterized protein with NAD-binding domain and iron-sulfur cluster